MMALTLFFLMLSSVSLYGSSASLGHSIADRVEQVENELFGTFSAESIESEVRANEQLIRLRVELSHNACLLLYLNKTYLLA